MVSAALSFLTLTGAVLVASRTLTSGPEAGAPVEQALAQGPDGAIWVAEDGKGARLLKLTAP